MWGYRDAAMFWVGMTFGALVTAIVIGLGWFIGWVIF